MNLEALVWLGLEVAKLNLEREQPKFLVGLGKSTREYSAWNQWERLRDFGVELANALAEGY
jgi:hypothetical protein